MEETVRGGARQRHLSYPAAKAAYDIARSNFLEEMEQLEDPIRGAIPEPQLREKYVAIKNSEQQLVKAGNEVKRAMERSGFHLQEDRTKVDNEIIALQTRL